MNKALSAVRDFATGLVKDERGNVSVQQIMGIIFAVILVVDEKLPTS